MGISERGGRIKREEKREGGEERGGERERGE